MPRKSRARRPPSAAFDDRSDARYATGIDAARRRGSHSGMMARRGQTGRAPGRVGVGVGGGHPGVFDRGGRRFRLARARGRRGSRRRAPSRWSGSSGWRDRAGDSRGLQLLARIRRRRAPRGRGGGTRGAGRAREWPMSLSAPGRRVVPDTARGVGASARTSYKRSSDDAAGGRANRRRRGRRRRRRAGIRDREADERRHGRARERDESQRARGRTTPPGAAPRGRRAGPIGVSRSTATFNARFLGTRASGSRRSVVRASTSFEDAIEVAVAAVSGGGRARRRGASPDAPRSGRAPTDTGRGERSSSAGVLAAALGLRGSTPLLGRARSHVLCLGFPRSNGGFDRSDRNRAREYDRSSRNRPAAPPRSRSTNHVLPAHHAPRNHSRFPRPARRTALGARARAGYPREPRHSRRAPVPRRCVSPRALSRRTSPLSRASVRVPPRPLTSPAPPFAAIDPRVVTRPDRRRLARCPPAPRSSGARSLRASPAPCVKRAGARRGSPDDVPRRPPLAARRRARRVRDGRRDRPRVIPRPARADNLEGVAGDAASAASAAAAASRARSRRLRRGGRRSAVAPPTTPRPPSSADARQSAVPPEFADVVRAAESDSDAAVALRRRRRRRSGGAQPRRVRREATPGIRTRSSWTKRCRRIVMHSSWTPATNARVATTASPTFAVRNAEGRGD